MIIDNQIILNRYDCKQFLASIGFDNFQIEDFVEAFNTSEDKIDWKQEAKEWELDSMHQFEKRNDLINEIINIADDLATGKGGTKKQYAERLKNVCEFYY